jgi:1,4-dihydroxy-2-naphthoyl-CoA hydrolase
MKADISQTVLATLGIELAECTRERVVATMPVTPKTHQPWGMMQGGVSLVLAESVASVGSTLFIDVTKQRAVGLEINANHIHSKSDGVVHAVGVPLHVGRRTIVWDIRIYDEMERLICVSRCTIAIIDLTDSK